MNTKNNMDTRIKTMPVNIGGETVEICKSQAVRLRRELKRIIIAITEAEVLGEEYGKYVAPDRRCDDVDLNAISEYRAGKVTRGPGYEAFEGFGKPSAGGTGKPSKPLGSPDLEKVLADMISKGTGAGVVQLENDGSMMFHHINSESIISLERESMNADSHSQSPSESTQQRDTNKSAGQVERNNEDLVECLAKRIVSLIPLQSSLSRKEVEYNSVRIAVTAMLDLGYELQDRAIEDALIDVIGKRKWVDENGLDLRLTRAWANICRKHSK